MKNLKKILLAVLVLALLATAVVVTVLAADGDEAGGTYEGSIAEARSKYFEGASELVDEAFVLLNDVPLVETDAQKTARLMLVKSKLDSAANKLADFHIYVFGNNKDKAPQVDPFEDGYEDLMLEFSDTVLKAEQCYLSVYKKVEDKKDKEAVLKKAHALYAKCPVYTEYESLNEEGYQEWMAFRKNYTIEAVKILTPYLDFIAEAEDLDTRYKKLNELYYLFNHSTYERIYFMLPADDDATYEVPGLSDFVYEYNMWCMTIASEKIDTVETPEQMTKVLTEFRSSNNAYNRDPDFFNKVYLPLVEKMDLNIIKYANVLLDEVEVTAENYNGEAIENLKVAFKYIEDTQCIALTRTQLADTVGAAHEALQKRVSKLIHEISLYYYAEVEKHVEGDEAAYSNAVADFTAFVKSCPSIIFRPAVTPDSYNGSLSEAEELLSAVRDGEKNYLDSFAALYSYLSKTAVDPELEGASEFYAKYESLKNDVSAFVIRFLKDLDYAPTADSEKDKEETDKKIDEEVFREELEKLGQIAAFLNTAPVSSSAVNEYNKTTLAFIETIEKLWCRQIEYKTPEAAEATGKLSEAQALLEAVDLTSDTAFEAYAALYEYVTKTPVDVTLPGAEAFYKQYAALTAKVARILGKNIDSLSAKLTYAEIFASDCPEITYTVPEFRSLDGTVEDATALLTAVKALVNSGADLAEVFEAYALLYKYNYEFALKSELEGADTYATAFEALTQSVSKLVVEALEEFDAAPLTEDEDGKEVLDKDALKESVDSLKVIAAFLKECPVTAEAVEAYNTLRSAFAESISSSYGEEKNEERFTSDHAKLMELANYLEKVSISSELFAAYNAKALEFKASLSVINCPTVEYKVFASESFDGNLENAKLLLEDAKAASKLRLESFIELYQYVRKNAISPKEDGAEFFYSEYKKLVANISEEILFSVKSLNPNSLYISEYPELVYTAFEPLSYGGNLAEANALLSKVKYALGDAAPDVNEVMAAYVDLASYVRKSSVPTDVPGATKFYRDYEKVKADVTDFVLENIEPITSTIEVKIEYATAGKNEDAQTKYTAANDIIDKAGDSAYNDMLEEYAALYAHMTKYGVQIDSKDENVAKEAKAFYEKFLQLTDEIHNIVVTRLARAGELSKTGERQTELDRWRTYLGKTPVSYATVEAFNKAVDAHNARVSKDSEKVKTYDIYFDLTVKFANTGSVAKAEELYAKVDVKRSEFLEAYKTLYSFMVTSGVDINASKAADADLAKTLRTRFIELTKEAHNIIAHKLSAVRNIENSAEKLAALKEWAAFLESTPVSYATVDEYNEVALEYELSLNKDVLGFIRDTYISEKAVNAYNEILGEYKYYVRGTLVPEDSALEEFYASIVDVAEFLKAAPVSLEAVTAYNSLLDDVTASLKRKIDAEYGDFISAKEALDSFLKVMEKKLASEKVNYTVLPEDVDYEAFAEKLSNLENFAAIKTVADYISTTDFDKLGIKLPSVDEFRENFAQILNDIIAADLLKYESAPENDVYSGSVTEAQNILDKYNAAAGADAKAEIFKELYDYVTTYVMNPKLNGYEAFMKNYKAAGEEVYKSFVEKISDATDKNAAIKVMRDYLEKTPISQAAIEAYNMQYLYTYNDQLQETYKVYSEAMLKLHEFIENTEGVSEFIENFGGLSEAIDNYETLETLALVQFYEMKVLEEDPNATTVSVTQRGAAVKVLNNYVRKYPIGEGSYAYAETMADVNGISDAYKQLIEDARAALDDKTPLEDYENDIYRFIADNDNGKAGLALTHADPSVGTQVTLEDDTARGGQYAKYSYGSDTKNAFLGTSGIPGTIPLVLEFDITGDNGVVHFTFNRLDRTTGSAVQQTMFSISNNKFSFPGEGSEKWKEREVITPGEWTKFIFVYDPVNITLTGYIDYELVGTWSVRYKTNPNDPLVEIRFNGASVNTSFNLDNFRIYSGSNYRILDKFESMTLGEEFEYFVNYMNDETRLSTSRLAAYQKATALLGAVKADAELTAELADVIERYNSADVEKDVIIPAKAANLEKIKEKGTLLASFEGRVNTSNYQQVQALVQEIEEFVADNSEYIDKASPDYKEVSASISRFKSLIDRCNNVTLFVKSLDNFNRSNTLAAKNKYFVSAEQYFELAGLYLESVRLEVMSDPAVLEFEAKLNDGSAAGDDGYVDILTYYENCEKEITAQANKENSKRIIDCIGFVLDLEGYESTEEFWQANFEYINKYMTIIRDIVRTNTYDETFPGVEDAIEAFRVIDVYFYNILQENHIAFISERLDEYEKKDSYIEKLGICTYVSNYIEANDIDMSNATLAALVLKNETYKAELEIYREEYITILNQNTVKFVNIVGEMKTQVSYKALCELYNDALAYYYEMNITPDSEAAIAEFEQYAETIKKMEEDSLIFIGYANAIAKARTDAALYKALVNCKSYVDLAAKDYDGVADAIADYEAALSEYNAKAELINGDISEVNSVVTVMRTNSIAGAVMSVIDRIFNR